MTDSLDKLWNALPILIVNGATLLIVVVLLIRMLAKGAEGLKAELASLRADIRDAGQDIRDAGKETAVAVGALTERVSRIEGKIEGIAIAAQQNPQAAAQFADDDDHMTPVQVPIPSPRARTQPGGLRASPVPTPIKPGTDDPNAVVIGRDTPSVGVPRFPGTYGPKKPKAGG